MRGLAVALVVVALATAFSARAQEPAPSADLLATIVVRNSGRVTFASGGDNLVAASGRQLAVFDLTDPARPRRLVLLALDNEPLALAAAADFSLTAVGAEGEADSLLVIAPDKYSRGGFGIVNVLDIPKGTHLIALSPNREWALASGSGAYVVMALRAADSIEISAHFETGDTPLIGAALTDDTALVIRSDSPQVAAVPLGTSSDINVRADALTLDAPAAAIAISEDAALGAVALADNRLTLFEPQTLKILANVTLDDGPANEISFLSAGSRRYLALKIDGRAAVMLLDVTRPDAVTLPGSIAVEGPARALATDGSTLAISDDTGIRLFEISAPAP